MAKSKKRAASAARNSSPLAATIFSGSSPAPGDVIPIPSTSSFNRGLSSADESTMLRAFGTPGARTDQCSPVTGQIRNRIASRVNVGPFVVSGLDIAVASLKQVFDDAVQQIPDVVAAVKSAGMLCVRHKRNNPSSFSNHSWGTAIDLYFGTDVVPQGKPRTYRGCLQLAPFFNQHGWYGGAGFSGRSVDSMHFELSKEAIHAAQAPDPSDSAVG